MKAVKIFIAILALSAIAGMSFGLYALDKSQHFDHAHKKK